MQQRSSKRRSGVLANKIGALFSNACGITRSPNMALGLGFGIGIAAVEDDEKDSNNNEEKEINNGGKDRPLSASNKSQGCNQIQVHASAVLTRKWKTSLKKVQLTIKKDLNTRTKKLTATGAENNELELCKKRILMGEKCRALNLSGVLHYDNQGILLPED